MATNNLKQELHKTIDTIDEDEILQRIKEHIDLEIITSKLGENLKPYTQKEFIAMLQESEEQYKRGYFYTHEEVKDIIKGWRTKDTK